MVEVKNEEQEETMREVGHLLLEVKCLARLGALASDSCICDDELQMQDNLEYYFILSFLGMLATVKIIPIKLIPIDKPSNKPLQKSPKLLDPLLLK